jgi:hypothetical protein
MAFETKSVRAVPPASDAGDNGPRADSEPRAVTVPRGGPPPIPQHVIDAAQNPGAASTGPPGPGPSAPDDSDEAARRAAKRRPAGPSRGRIAANDDAPSIGGLIYALNQKPSNKPYIWAAVASGVWAAASLGFAWVVIGPDLLSGKSFLDVFGRTNLATAFATLTGPIALFWFLAMLAWRADEMKLRST